MRHTLRADVGGWAPLHEELLEEMLQIYSLHPQNYYALQVARWVSYVACHRYTLAARFVCNYAEFHAYGLPWRHGHSVLPSYNRLGRCTAPYSGTPLYYTTQRVSRALLCGSDTSRRRNEFHG